MHFSGIYFHYFKSFRFDSKSLNTRKSSFDFISIGKHIFNESVIFLHLFLVDMLLGEGGEGISNSRAVVTFFMFIETDYSATFFEAFRAGIFSEGYSADLAQLLPACNFSNDELRRLLVLADGLALLKFALFVIFFHQQPYIYICDNVKYIFVIFNLIGLYLNYEGLSRGCVYFSIGEGESQGEGEEG